MFLLYTNHQPVRNYAYRKMGKLPPIPSDPWHPDQIERAGQPGGLIVRSPPELDLDAYDPCYAEPLSPEPEALYEADIHGPGYISSKHLMSDYESDDGGNSTRSSSSRGQLVVPGPSPAKKRRLDTE